MPLTQLKTTHGRLGKHCDEWCKSFGCGGVPREKVIDILVNDHEHDRDELERLEDDAINRISSEYTDAELDDGVYRGYGIPHIKA